MISEDGGLVEGVCWGTGNFKWECLITLRCLVAFLRNENNFGLMVLRRMTFY